MSCNPHTGDSWLGARPTAARTGRSAFPDPTLPVETGIADGVDTRSKATAVCSTGSAMQGVSAPPPTAIRPNAREFAVLGRAACDCGAALPVQQAA